MKGKNSIGAVVLFLLVLLTTAQAQWPKTYYVIRNDDVSVKFKHNRLVFYYEHANVEKMVLTEDAEMYLDGERVDLNDEDKKLAKELYDRFERARNLGYRIGKKGAKLGIKATTFALTAAVRSIIQALFFTDDESGMQKDLEEKEKKLKDQGKEIEELAEKLLRELRQADQIYKELAWRLPDLPDVDLYTEDR